MFNLVLETLAELTRLRRHRAARIDWRVGTVEKILGREVVADQPRPVAAAPGRARRRRGARRAAGRASPHDAGDARPRRGACSAKAGELRAAGGGQRSRRSSASASARRSATTRSSSSCSASASASAARAPTATWTRPSRRLRELDGKVDAFGLGGIDLFLHAAGRDYYFRDAKRFRDAVQGTPLLDGTGLKGAVEADVVRFMREDLGLDARGQARAR